MKKLALKNLVFMALAFLLMFSAYPMSVNATTTEVRITPSMITVGEVGQPIPTEIITVNVTVVNVVDLYSWQVKIYYNPDVLIWTGAWYPEDHVFAGRVFQSVEPTNETDGGGTYILHFATLVGEQPTFNGSGVLCSFNFTAKAVGTSQLEIDTTPPSPYSWLLDFELEFIPFTASSGTITVVSEFQFLIMPLLLFLSTVAILASKKLMRKNFQRVPQSQA